MTIKEVIKKYGNVPLLFSGYYKYRFGFKGTAKDGAEIYVSYGGNSDDIYRYNVSRNKPEYLVDKKYNLKEPEYLLAFDYVVITMGDEEIFKCDDRW